MRRALIAAFTAAALPCVARAETWSERGIEVGASAVAEMLYATQPRNWPARLDLSASVELDLGTLTGWSAMDHVYAFALPTLAWGEEEDWHWKARLYVAWLKWDGSEKWNILAGYYDPTWDFHSLPSTAPFVRLPSRVGGEFSPGSPGLLDLYPLAAPAIRVELKPESHLAIQVAALLLDEEYELHGRRAVVEFDSGRRGLFLAEVAWRTTEEEAEKHGHFHAGLGGWFLTAQSSWGIYAFADKALWRETTDRGQGLSTFLSASLAGSGDRSLDSRISAGCKYRGIIPHRDDDVTAFAIIHERLGDARSQRTAWELLHRIPLTEESWLQFTVLRQSRDDWRIGFTIGCEL